jgi:hypothetical protein
MRLDAQGGVVYFMFISPTPTPGLGIECSTRCDVEVDQLYNFVEVEVWLWDNTQF